MLFNSYVFIFLFLPIAVFGYFAINRAGKFQYAKAFLLGMSLYFYAYFNISYLPIIVFSIVFNYSLYALLQKNFKQGSRRLLLVVGISVNLGVLFYFKYFNFFMENINVAFNSDFFLHQLVLPLGISFFTFQQLSYIIDSYRKEVPNYNILDYALFVTFFPQLIAGPIVLHSEMVPQFADTSKKRMDYSNLSKGLFAFTLGLAKKVLLADLFGKVVANGYENIAGLSTIDAAVVILAFTMQIYFDFSGYCDMAIGIGYMFNIKIPQNFNSPYKALDIGDFWKSWHMTLTRFFRTYLYYPLGGNRKGEIRTFFNIMVVFVLSGFWHGANWTFLVWGALHGIALVFTKILYPQLKKIPRAIRWRLTFIFINITWVYFRASSISDANLLLSRLLSLDISINNNLILGPFNTAAITAITGFFLPNTTKWDFIIMALWFAIALYFAVFAKNTNERIDSFKARPLQMVTTAILLFWSVVSLSGFSVFIYFNF